MRSDWLTDSSETQVEAADGSCPTDGDAPSSWRRPQQRHLVATLGTRRRETPLPGGAKQEEEDVEKEEDADD